MLDAGLLMASIEHPEFVHRLFVIDNVEITGKPIKIGRVTAIYLLNDFRLSSLCPVTNAKCGSNAVNRVGLDKLPMD